MKKHGQKIRVAYLHEIERINEARFNDEHYLYKNSLDVIEQKIKKKNEKAHKGPEIAEKVKPVRAKISLKNAAIGTKELKEIDR